MLLYVLYMYMYVYILFIRVLQIYMKNKIVVLSHCMDQIKGLTLNL